MRPSRQRTRQSYLLLGDALRSAILPLLAVLVLPPSCPLAAVGAAAATTFRVGLVGPWQCDPFFAKALPAVAAQLAVRHINGDPSLSHAETFDYALLQEPCETSKALEAYLGFNAKASGFIGPINPGYCDAASLVGRGWNKPVFSWGCVGDELDDARGHPTFAHSMPRPAQVLVNLMRYFRWAHVAVVASFQDVWVETATKLANSLRGHGMPVRTVEFIENKPHGVKTTLDKIRKMGDIRLVILCMHSVLLGGYLQGQLLETAYDMGMTEDGQLAFVPYDALLYSLPYGRDVRYAVPTPPGGGDGGARLRAAYDAVLTVTVDSPGMSFYEALAGAVRRGEVAKHLKPQQVSPLFGTIYSSIVLMAHAMQALRTSGDPLTGESLARHARNLTFQGFSHPVRTSASGAAMVNYVVLDTDGLSWELKPTHMIDMEFNRLQFLGRDIHFPSGYGPSEDHSCWFTKGALCTGGVDIYTAAGIIFGPLLSAVFAVALIYVIRRFVRMMRHRSKMMLSLSDVTFVHPALYTRKPGEQSPNISGVSELEHSLSSVSIETPPNHENSCVVVFEGDWAWLKKLPPGSFSVVNHSLRDVFQLLTDLHHENVNPFFAFYYEAGVFATVTEYASRGSLEDLALNQDVKLDWMFKYSLLMDLVKGMKYLHSKGLIHGRLKSRNCVVDGRFGLKVTDHGYRSILDAQDFPCPEPEPEELLWTAPEILRLGHPMPPGTPAGDVYSFSIIMQELVSRGRPYCMLRLSVPELLERLRKHTPPLCRPVLSPDYAPPDCIELAHDCWHEQPEKRPDFDEIFDRFKEINRGMKYNIIDSMLRMLEQYSSNLAELIKERTEELEIEKHKTERLLTQMLPPSVADVLKTGGKVAPEDFDSASLYFSDIVGFTTISANSEPIDVVNLLNDLYTVFDAIIGEHGVYKVETIGDAYMVASGVPVRNGKRHAAEIANMSLDILSAVGVFKMRHMPDVPVRIRIGLHSGPVVAGVVGLTMPRYCLFGETVTTASLMESSGQPSRIQVHEHMVKILMELKDEGYKVQLRGRSEIKGALTYWLTGRNGFNKPLPVPPNFKSKQHGQKTQAAEIAASKKKQQQQLAKKNK